MCKYFFYLQFTNMFFFLIIFHNKKKIIGDENILLFLKLPKKKTKNYSKSLLYN